MGVADAVTVAVGGVPVPRAGQELHRPDGPVVQRVSVQPAAVGVPDHHGACEAAVEPRAVDRREGHSCLGDHSPGEAAVVGLDPSYAGQQRPVHPTRRCRHGQDVGGGPVRAQSGLRDAAATQRRRVHSRVRRAGFDRRLGRLGARRLPREGARRRHRKTGRLAGPVRGGPGGRIRVGRLHVRRLHVRRLRSLRLRARGDDDGRGRCASPEQGRSRQRKDQDTDHDTCPGCTLPVTPLSARRMVRRFRHARSGSSSAHVFCDGLTVTP